MISSLLSHLPMKDKRIFRKDKLPSLPLSSTAKIGFNSSKSLSINFLGNIEDREWAELITEILPGKK